MEAAVHEAQAQRPPLAEQPAAAPEVPRLRTIRQFADAHVAFSEARLRNLIFNAVPRHSSRGVLPANGLAEALVRIGRRVYIDEAKFFGWIEAQRKAA